MLIHSSREKHMKRISFLVLGFIIISGIFVARAVSGDSDIPGLVRIQRNVTTGFSNGGWSYDRYSDLKSLNARTAIVVADLKGPGIIRHIHTTRHSPEQLFTRGIVLEIWFDNAEEPAVQCPLGDFFGDGCNGKSDDFSSLMVECAPWSYNCYFPMPFRTSARVILRNDTDSSAMNYSYVEWESLPAWDETIGYFHATYTRRCFQLTKNTAVTFFEMQGAGHLIGRQFSIVTDEPIFRSFQYVMEGNNEVDIDGSERRLDYLGTEDSFTFSWGFQKRFAGLRAGMPVIETGERNQLSIYRFHEQMPIRFKNSLRWSINWANERLFTNRPEWQKAVEDGGCWVDYATVFYWYGDSPSGYKHQQLSPVSERQKPRMRP